MDRLPPLLRASVESFLYRGPSPLFKELTAILTDALAGDQAAVDRAGKAIQHHTGMKVHAQVVSSFAYGVSITVPNLDVNHVMRDAVQPMLAAFEGQKVEYGHVKAFLNGAEGKIDRHGRVSGVFEQIGVALEISDELLAGEFTPEEIAALILHEVGHLYGYFATLGRTVATSFLISQTLQILANTTDLTARTHAVEAAVLALDLGEHVDSAALAVPGEEQAFQMVLVRETVLKVASDQGGVEVFANETELVADSYATHSGAAKPLVSAFMRIARHYKHAQFLSKLEFQTVQSIKYALLVVAALHPAALLAASLIGSLVVAGSVGDRMSRVSPIDRLDAVHHDLVAILKDRSLPKAQLEQVLDDLKYVSAMRQTLTDNRGLVTTLYLTLDPTKRKLYKQQQLQKAIGRLVNNDLYAQAAELGLLKKNS